ncbi:ester cyclase [Actinomadura roseirufa]|uniref:ester cyclase n=1 Tax=Actinomadura roseirufa TaxID=2094049 RepID=UPI001F5FB02F|nr:ester cyclase [Actinomadura roseirufa]
MSVQTAQRTARARKQRIAQLFERVITLGELDLADEIFAPDFIWPQFGLRGPDGVRAWVRAFRTAFPDVVDRVREQYCDGDVVVTRVALTGTQRGTYLGMPPTGRRAAWTAVGIDRFRGDRVIERTALFDPLDLMRDLGHTRIDLGG